MTGTFQQQLEREVRRASVEAFNEAVRTVQTEFTTADNQPGEDGVPLDTGFLREQFRVTQRSTNTDVLRATVEVEAFNFDSNPPYDYASGLNRVRRYTTMFGPNTGVTNKWFDWWRTWWGGLDSESTRWVDATQNGIDRSFER